jgi:hypothetical protein
MHPIPLGKSVVLVPKGRIAQLVEHEGSIVAQDEGEAARFRIVDMGAGRVALALGSGHLSINATGDAWVKPGEAGVGETFLWMESIYGEPMLMSLATNRYLTVDPASGQVSATSPGARSDRTDHARFVVAEAR